MQSQLEPAPKQRNKKTVYSGIIPSVLFAVIVCTVLFFFIFFREHSAVPVNAGISAEGKAYLRSLSEKDPSEIDNVLRERRRLTQEREALEDSIRKIESDEVDIWSLYQDYVILGDSRCEAFSFYSFLQKSHVLAETGSSIYMAFEHVPEIRIMKPSYVFLCYGINDMAMSSWKTGDDYAEVMRNCISQIHDASPDSLIVISSILPVTEAVLKRHPEFLKIPSFNDGLKKLCDETAFAVFADNDTLVEAHKDLFASDGIHMDAKFYSYWAKNLYISVLKNQISEKTQEAGAISISNDE